MFTVWYNENMRKKKWTKSQLVSAAESTTSYRQVLLILGLKPAGGNYDQIKKYIKKYKIDITHFKGHGWSKGLKVNRSPVIPLKNILVRDSDYQTYKLKKRLFKVELKKPVCEECGWCQKSLLGHVPVELHHINGNSRDNRLSNLKVLCPNCHSLKATHRGRNIGKANCWQKVKF